MVLGVRMVTGEELVAFEGGFLGLLKLVLGEHTNVSRIIQRDGSTRHCFLDPAFKWKIREHTAKIIRIDTGHSQRPIRNIRLQASQLLSSG